MKMREVMTTRRRRMEARDILDMDEANMPDMDQQDRTDRITVDVPLFIRLMEYAREDAKGDVDLHEMASRAVKLSQDNTCLDMDDYDLLVGGEVREAVSMDGFNNLRDLLRGVEQKQDVTLRIGGEEVTLTYPEARFLAGQYRAYNRAGRQEEFMRDLEDPVEFDRHMLKLRKLIDKQKDFLASSREQKLDEKAPPDFPKDLYRKLKAQYKDNPERAYATMWMIHNRKKRK